MTKKESQMMKGVAILLMIFLHLFNQRGNVDLCENLIIIDGSPLVLILSRAADPVPFFLILGGFGLYKVYIKGDKHRWTRLLKLLIHYWIVLVIFLSIGHYLYPSTYPGSFKQILSNATGFNTTYNDEMWFLLPYMILSALSPCIFRLMAKIKAMYIVGATFTINLCTSYCISRFGEEFLFHNHWVYIPLLVLHLLFSFSLGAIAAKTKFFDKFKDSSKKINCSWFWCVALALIAVNCIFKYNYFYAFGMIMCLLIAPIPGFIKNILCKFGDQSMNMWMIHTWFCYYLFHQFVYSFTYPIVIFAVVVILSYVSSWIVNLIALPIERLVLTEKEIKTKPIL